MNQKIKIISSFLDRGTRRTDSGPNEYWNLLQILAQRIPVSVKSLRSAWCIILEPNILILFPISKIDDTKENLSFFLDIRTKGHGPFRKMDFCVFLPLSVHDDSLKWSTKNQNTSYFWDGGTRRLDIGPNDYLGAKSLKLRYFRYQFFRERRAIQVLDPTNKVWTSPPSPFRSGF